MSLRAEHYKTTPYRDPIHLFNDNFYKTNPKAILIYK